MTVSKTQAIQTALTGDWNTAIALNKELLKVDPNDIETLNRLAFSFTVLGKMKDAKSTYQKVLRLDSQNPIALKNLKRLTVGSHAGGQTPVLGVGLDTMFLEESGKTKVIELLNIADPKVIIHLMTGESVTLRIKRLKIFVLDAKEQFIGMLPEDIGRRLIKFMKGGNSYQAWMKSVENHRVTVFIKEEKRSSRFKNQPSFTSGEKTKGVIGKNYSSFNSRESEDAPEDDSETES